MIVRVHVHVFTQKLAQELHEDGKALHKAGFPVEALQKFIEALELCKRHNLKPDAADIYYSTALVHTDLGDYQTAFSECTISVQIRPIAKVLR